MESKKIAMPVTCKSRLVEKCLGCTAMKLQSSAHIGDDGITIELHCENEVVCDALEDRRWASFLPCDPGDDLYFANGQTGRVEEVAFCIGSDVPVVRCQKFIGDTSYDMTFSSDDLGKTVFLSPNE